MLGLILPARVFGMAEVRTLHLLLRRDRSGRFTSRHGIASHRLLESGRGEDERYADRFGANVLRTYPCIRRNEHEPSGMEIAFLIAEPNVSRSAMDQHYLILDQVPVLW